MGDIYLGYNYGSICGVFQGPACRPTAILDAGNTSGMAARSSALGLHDVPNGLAGRLVDLTRKERRDLSPLDEPVTMQLHIRDWIEIRQMIFVFLRQESIM